MLDRVSSYVCALVWLTYDVPVVCPDDLGTSSAHYYSIGSVNNTYHFISCYEERACRIPVAIY